MNLENQTKNQHFLPQVEQRLNAINPNAKKENQRIYAFTVEDRISTLIKLQSKNGVKINCTLSLNDLFSFDIPNQNSTRFNFERLFYQYELGIKINTENLINKLRIKHADIKSEVLNIFVFKLLNFIRNPYSIKKILNTFPSLVGLYPTDVMHYQNFQQVLNGRKPQQEFLCKQLNISEEEYTKWLAILFMLLIRLEENKPNFLEQCVKGLFENPDTYSMVIIHTYDEKTCLLSDRGFSNPLPQDDHLVFDFNLYSKGFIRYVFGNIDKLAPQNAPQEMIEYYKSMRKAIDVQHSNNDLNALAQYNKIIVTQCFETVFNSNTECYGVLSE